MAKKLNLNKIVETFNKALKIAKKEGVNFIAISGDFGSTLEVVEARTVSIKFPVKETVILVKFKNGFAILDDFQCEELFENSKRWIDYKKEKK
jgi:predicted Rossmann-fold nucleotide-binding protein